MSNGARKCCANSKESDRCGLGAALRALQKTQKNGSQYKAVGG